MAPTLTLCGKAASRRYAGPAFGCPTACGLVFAAPTGGAAFFGAALQEAES
jgi:hypothetical protein